jgi:hypothetical protein
MQRRGGGCTASTAGWGGGLGMGVANWQFHLVWVRRSTRQPGAVEGALGGGGYAQMRGKISRSG